MEGPWKDLLKDGAPLSSELLEKLARVPREEIRQILEQYLPEPRVEQVLARLDILLKNLQKR